MKAFEKSCVRVDFQLRFSSGRIDLPFARHRFRCCAYLAHFLPLPTESEHIKEMQVRSRLFNIKSCVAHLVHHYLFVFMSKRHHFFSDHHTSHLPNTEPNSRFGRRSGGQYDSGHYPSKSVPITVSTSRTSSGGRFSTKLSVIASFTSVDILPRCRRTITTAAIRSEASGTETGFDKMG